MSTLLQGQQIEIFANMNRSRRRIELFIDVFDERGSNVATVCRNGITFTDVSIEKTLIDEPAPLSITDDAAVKLMDQLWRIGIRPTEQGTIGELDATRRHLEDMRDQSKLMLNHIFSLYRNQGREHE